MQIYTLNDIFFGSNETKVAITMASKTITRKNEVRMYPIESFISEFGGALGLFLGFSFLMVWDFLKVILISERTKRCYSTIDEC